MKTESTKTQISIPETLKITKCVMALREFEYTLRTLEHLKNDIMGLSEEQISKKDYEIPWGDTEVSPANFMVSVPDILDAYAVDINNFVYCIGEALYGEYPFPENDKEATPITAVSDFLMDKARSMFREIFYAVQRFSVLAELIHTTEQFPVDDSISSFYIEPISLNEYLSEFPIVLRTLKEALIEGQTQINTSLF